VIFTLHESSNTLTAQRFDVNEPSNPAQFIGSVMITPELTNGTQFNAAELLVPPGSDASQGLLLYASNRNKGPTFDDQEDCITIVRYTPAPTPGAADTLTFVRQWPTGLREIRGMAFSNDGKYLVAGGQMNGIVKVFQVGPDDMLAEIANSTVGGGRTSFVWMDQ
jgi:6-phosphogluconolactonase (cycloisomerase 2 family)